MSDKAGKESQYMVSHPGLGSDPPIWSDQDSGCDKDSFRLDGVFYAFIAIGLLRDNEGAVIENYSSSLIGEIRFDLQDKLLLRITLLPLLVRFGLI